MNGNTKKYLIKESDREHIRNEALKSLLVFWTPVNPVDKPTKRELELLSPGFEVVSVRHSCVHEAPTSITKGYLTLGDGEDDLLPLTQSATIGPGAPPANPCIHLFLGVGRRRERNRDRFRRCR